ncbi:MAG: molybdopterin-binding protein [Methylohalobius sp.]|nr:molybdopterin-binding protein [Methylohalobius sp.]
MEKAHAAWANDEPQLSCLPQPPLSQVRFVPFATSKILKKPRWMCMARMLQKCRQTKTMVKKIMQLLSARNQFTGKVKEVLLGTVVAEVVVDISGKEIVAVITRKAAESMGLKEGKEVVAAFKATDVMIKEI